jgi:hypothetical protein
MHGTTVPLDVGRQQSLARVEALARLMDERSYFPPPPSASVSMASSD